MMMATLKGEAAPPNKDPPLEAGRGGGAAFAPSERVSVAVAIVLHGHQTLAASVVL